MPEAKFERPTVVFTRSGVPKVSASDILLSRAGRAEIQKAANVAVSRDLRKDGSKLLGTVDTPK